jgi:LPXTG-site transpeptidase (sortase) family protein
MKIKAVCALIISSTLLAVFIVAPSPTYAADPVSSSEAGEAFHLEIPALKLDVSVIKAQFTGRTWDFSEFTQQAGYFEKLPLPGQKGNAVIGAHSELAQRKPGPFYTLDQIKIGDQIIITQGDEEYTYVVTEISKVKPTDTSPLTQTNEETLTLLTCAGYSNGIYTTRLVVHAARVTE